MNLNVAKQFVADFVKGDYTPEEYATFLRWLRGARAEELNEIMNEHESMHEHWDAAGLVPSEVWKGRLEDRLDQAEKVGIPVIGENWFVRRRGWVAAASVAVVIAGGAYFFSQHKAVNTDTIRQDMPVMAKAAESPVGGENKQVVLPDGSRVLLNVASTLRYPEAFGSTERVVELSGEGYFEVMPDASKPFRVVIKDAALTVLGTNFNIRAYSDELESRTTLIDGSVEMKSGSGEKRLKPGQQARIGYASVGGSDEIKISNADVDAILAWEKGDFKFVSEDINTVMRVVARYYGVEVKVDPDVVGKMGSGVISRSHSLTQTLNQVSANMGVKMTPDGKTVRVSL